ncbi:group II intron reverse transcriptase/maturase [Clostridium perfringens]|nr:group II intron reverse transcriptase/maturase [Clostridium perfringens]
MTVKKRQTLRNNEYYSTQQIYDELYDKSKKGIIFTNLLEHIQSEKNVRLAYRNLKKNKGSKTPGINKTIIKNIVNEKTDKMVKYIGNRLMNYSPHPVKRVEIPKYNGKLRPLGIPSMEDRLVQQCIKQVLEPICEAKFYHHSYGFRPNRSTHHALANAMHRINQNKMHYVVDIDIKGFFDNVNHGKLIKQIWSLGIRDKQLLMIISKMLKAEIKGVGIPKKGTPQGGILSPLLSNIVLNELDWWISSQWENMKTKREYAVLRKYDTRQKHAALKKSNLKQMFIVRYADDFKIFCNDYKTAQKAFIATKNWLKERLDLDISPEKSRVTNLRKNSSEFLGFKLKAVIKNNKYVCKSNLTSKAKNSCRVKLKKCIKQMSNNPIAIKANDFNSTVLGIHNYYKIASHVSIDFYEIWHKLMRCARARLRKHIKKNAPVNLTFLKFYGDYKSVTYSLAGVTLYPPWHIRTKPPMNFNRDLNNYTEEGREQVHKRLTGISQTTIARLMKNPIISQSVEFNDNRISLFVAQKGMCGISKINLDIFDMEVHHKIPKSMGGTDEYKNLIILTTEMHKLIHATTQQTINKYMEYLRPNKRVLGTINKYRKLAGNYVID